MVQVQVKLSDKEDRIVGLIKLNKKLVSKAEAIKYIINKYGGKK